MSAVATDNLGSFTSEVEDELTQATLNNTLASYAIGLLVTLVVLLVTALVAGEFAAAIENSSTNNTFSEGISNMVDSGNTAFLIFGVAILVIPAVAAVVLIVRGFGGMGGGGMGGMGR